MDKIKCDDCGRITEVEDFEQGTWCKVCKGDFTLLSSDNEDSDETEEDEEEESSEDSTCDECGEDFDKKDLIQFEESGVEICQSCIDELYPREQKVVEKKVIVDTSKDKPKTLNIKAKSRFD